MQTSGEPEPTAAAAERHRCDRALRLRRRIVIGIAASSSVALGGFAALAQHTFAVPPVTGGGRHAVSGDS